MFTHQCSLGKNKKINTIILPDIHITIYMNIRGGGPCLKLGGQNHLESLRGKMLLRKTFFARNLTRLKDVHSAARFLTAKVED